MQESVLHGVEKSGKLIVNKKCGKIVCERRSTYIYLTMEWNPTKWTILTKM